MTTPPEIPEAIVEKAARAIAPLNGCNYAECVYATIGDSCHCAAKARAGLEAAAPSLIAQGMREAADICEQLEFPGRTPDWTAGTLDCSNAILARAAEIEKVKP